MLGRKQNIQSSLVRIRPALIALLVAVGIVCAVPGANLFQTRNRSIAGISADDDAFLEDLSRRSFQYFLDQADPRTGLVRDRARATGAPVNEIASTAATGFGLTALTIGAERNWISRSDAKERTRTTLKFLAGITNEHGWFYHFIDPNDGTRQWKSETSSIDTALLLAGILTTRQYFSEDAEIKSLATKIYERVDFKWMLDGHPTLLSMGWRPENGFIKHRWDHYCELAILYVLGISSPTNSLPETSWYAWRRDWMTYGPYRYVSNPDPLFVHQFSHAWIDFRGFRERKPPNINYFENSIIATRAHRQFCIDLAKEFPGYTENVWGITASDSARGYVAWGGPPRHKAIDGTVVPCAAAGSLMFTPDITLPALREMKSKFGDKIYGKYGFVDAFNPNNGWVNSDVIGIDIGITLLSAENLRSGHVWRWFMKNSEIKKTLDRL